MTDPFEDHCGKDVMPPELMELYKHYKRELNIGPKAAILAIDLYEVAKAYPSSCGDKAYEAIAPTQKLLAAARAAGLPILHHQRDAARGQAGRGESRAISPSSARRRSPRWSIASGS